METQFWWASPFCRVLDSSSLLIGGALLSSNTPGYTLVNRDSGQQTDFYVLVQECLIPMTHFTFHIAHIQDHKGTQQPSQKVCSRILCQVSKVSWQTTCYDKSWCQGSIMTRSKTAMSWTYVYHCLCSPSSPNYPKAKKSLQKCLSSVMQ